MRWWFFSFAMAVLPLCGAANKALLTPVRVYTHFQQPPSALLTTSLQTEVESIMAPIGLTFRWLDIGDADGKQLSSELAVVNFLGRCDLDGMTARNAKPGPLGWTHVSDGEIIPFADVDCSAVRSFIQRELLGADARQRARTLGRALGRVVAHELYHIFAKTTHHGVDGVARESYTVRDLVTPDFQFEEKETLILFHSVGHAGMPPTDDEHRY
jgi:hypothetical protein